jgi:hypothetical protein
MKNLYLLPTDKPSMLFIDIDVNQSKISELENKIKQMYNKEDMIYFAQIAILNYKFGNTNIEQIECLKETFENFKKK